MKKSVRAWSVSPFRIQCAFFGDHLNSSPSGSRPGRKARLGQALAREPARRVHRHLELSAIAQQYFGRSTVRSPPFLRPVRSLLVSLALRFCVPFVVVFYLSSSFLLPISSLLLLPFMIRSSCLSSYPSFLLLHPGSRRRRNRPLRRTLTPDLLPGMNPGHLHLAVAVQVAHPRCHAG